MNILFIFNFILIWFIFIYPIINMFLFFTLTSILYFLPSSWFVIQFNLIQFVSVHGSGMHRIFIVYSIMILRFFASPHRCRQPPSENVPFTHHLTEKGSIEKWTTGCTSISSPHQVSLTSWSYPLSHLVF